MPSKRKNPPREAKTKGAKRKAARGAGRKKPNPKTKRMRPVSPPGTADSDSTEERYPVGHPIAGTLKMDGDIPDVHFGENCYSFRTDDKTKYYVEAAKIQQIANRKWANVKLYCAFVYLILEGKHVKLYPSDPKSTDPFKIAMETMGTTYHALVEAEKTDIALKNSETTDLTPLLRRVCIRRASDNEFGLGSRQKTKHKKAMTTIATAIEGGYPQYLQQHSFPNGAPTLTKITKRLSEKHKGMDQTSDSKKRMVNIFPVSQSVSQNKAT